jgi:hypothetical protein
MFSRAVGPVLLLFAGVLLFPRVSGPERAGALLPPPEGRGEALPCERLLLFAPLFPEGEEGGGDAGLLGGFVMGGDGLDPETLIHQPLQTHVIKYDQAMANTAISRMLETEAAKPGAMVAVDTTFRFSLNMNSIK